MEEYNSQDRERRKSLTGKLFNTAGHVLLVGGLTNSFASGLSNSKTAKIAYAAASVCLYLSATLSYIAAKKSNR
jgi:hypothetical protein